MSKKEIKKVDIGIAMVVQCDHEERSEEEWLKKKKDSK